jgi:hypothetical protein
MTVEQQRQPASEIIEKQFLGRMKNSFNSDFFAKTLISIACGIMFAHLMIGVWDKYQSRYEIKINSHPKITVKRKC